jgi:hypothetical protein
MPIYLELSFHTPQIDAIYVILFYQIINLVKHITIIELNKYLIY